jgi:hypothetical protein
MFFLDLLLLDSLDFDLLTVLFLDIFLELKSDFRETTELLFIDLLVILP